MNDLKEARTQRGRTRNTEGKMIGRVFEIINEIQSGNRSGHRRDTQSLSITMALQRTLTALYRRLHIPKCDHNCHKCSFMCSLRKQIENGIKMRMASVLKGDKYRKNL